MSSSTSLVPQQEDEREASDVLPSELWTEILLLLPVRSLLTLKLVSKTLLSLIDNRTFGPLHFSRFHNCHSQSNSIGSNLLLLERQIIHFYRSNCDYFLVRQSSTPRESIEFRTHVCRDQCCDIVGSVHGLLLLCSPSKYMILYNPLVGKRLMIPRSPSSDLGGSHLGFGYDPVIDDYKVVTIVYVKDEPLNPEAQVHASPRALVEVYSLKVGSWRTLGFDVLSRGWFLETDVYVNGCLHWIAGLDENYHGPYDYHLTHIVSFDLGTEQFSYRELPDFDEGRFYDMKLLLVLFHGSVAVVCMFTRQISFWVMRESDWSMECRVESVPNMLSYLLNEAFRIFSTIFSEERNELIAAGYYGMVSYNIGTQEFKHCDDYVTYVVKYVESLIWGEWVDLDDLDKWLYWYDECQSMEP